jgi:hypothetical protein
MDSPNPLKRSARIAGLLWLLTGVTGGFGLIYMRSSVIVTGDAGATAANIVSAEFYFRLAIVSTLLSQVFLFFLGISLFDLFKEVSKRLATILLAAVMLTAVIAVVNQLNNFGALFLLSQPDLLKSFSGEQINALALFLLRQANSTGQGLLEIFWIPYYFSFGLLIVKSRYLPRVFGFMLMMMSAGFALNLLDKFLIPWFYPDIFTRVAMTLSAIGVLSTMLWLLIMGAKLRTTDDQAASA